MKRIISVILAATVTFTMFSCDVDAAIFIVENTDKTIFVASNGNDNNIGSLENPYKTIQKAIDMSVPGSKIYVRGGTYTGCYSFNHSGNAETGYISLASYPGENVYLKLPTKKSEEYLAVFSLNGCDYISIDGFKIGNSSNQRVCGIYISKGSNHIIIKNNEIYKLKTNKPNDSSLGEANAILLMGDGIDNSESEIIKDITIINNNIHDNTNGWSENISVTGNCENVFVIKNVICNNTNIGIDFYGNNDSDGYCSTPYYNRPRNCTASYNIVYGCKSSYAECAGIYVDGAYNITINNNEVYKNMYGIEVGSEEWRDYYDDYSFGGVKSDLRVTNVAVTNNYVHNNPAGGIRIGGYTGDKEEPVTGTVINCEISYNNLKGNGSGKSGYNGELNFSKCDSINVYYNNITQTSDKYPVYEYGLDSKYATKIVLMGNKRNGKYYNSFK